MRLAPLFTLSFLAAACGGDDGVAVGLDARSVDAPATDAPPPISAATAEAVDDLLRIAQLSLARNAADGEFPTASIGLTPGAACCSFAGHVCALNAVEWTDWMAAIGFVPTGVRSYQYSYSGTASSVTVDARADADCDGRGHDIVLTCSPGGALAQCTITWPVAFD